MIEEEGVDTKEYYYKLKNMGWRVEMVGVKPDGNGIFIKTILLYLKSSDFRFIAVLIGVDLTSITQSTIQLECNYDRKYIVVNYYRDSSLCRTQPSRSEEIDWNICIKVPNQKMFVKVISGPDQFIYKPKPEPRYYNEEYYIKNKEKPVEVNGELVYPPIDYGPQNLSASDKASYSEMVITTTSSPASPNSAGTFEP